jgi:hypothetical protein
MDGLVDVCYEEERFPYDEIYQTGQEWAGMEQDGHWTGMARNIKVSTGMARIPGIYRYGRYGHWTGMHGQKFTGMDTGQWTRMVKNLQGWTAEVGKHPDLLVGPPTATVFRTNDRKYKKSQFFEKIFEKI